MPPYLIWRFVPLPTNMFVYSHSESNEGEGKSPCRPAAAAWCVHSRMIDGFTFLCFSRPRLPAEPSPPPPAPPPRTLFRRVAGMRKGEGRMDPRAKPSLQGGWVDFGRLFVQQLCNTRRAFHKHPRGLSRRALQKHTQGLTLPEHQALPPFPSLSFYFYL